MEFVFVQFLAIVASLVFALSFHSKSKNRILLWQLISLFIWATHFLLLSAWTGFALICINAVITCILLFKEKHTWARKPYILVLSILALGVATWVTWAGFYSIFSFLGVGLIVTAKWQDHPNRIRWISIPSSLFWIAYDGFVGSYGGIVSEIIFIISIVFSLIRNRRKIPNDIPFNQ